jgi:hypothetical protein
MGYFEEAFGGGTSQSFGGTSDNFSSGGGGGYESDSPSVIDTGGYVDTSSLAGLLAASSGTTPAAQSAAQQIQSAQQAIESSQAGVGGSGDATVDAILQMAQNVNLNPAQITPRYTTNFRSTTGNTGNALLNQLNRIGDMSTGYMERLLGAQMQLGQDAGVYSGFKDTGMQFPSFLSAGAGAIGKLSNKAMFEDITEKGYIPQFNSIGQIVATINPDTGQLGRGSVESRIDYNNPDNIAERNRLEGVGVSILDDYALGRTSTDETPEVPEYLLRGQGGGVAEPVTQDISMIPTGQIAAGGTPMARQTLLDVAPTQYGGLLAGQTPSDFDVMNRAFRMTGATYPEYFQDPYNLTGYSILT